MGCCRYVPPLRPPAERLGQYLPTGREAVEEELGKQQSLLRQLHGQLERLRGAGVSDAGKEQELWEVQMVETQLKRRLKRARAASTVEEPSGVGPCVELFEEKQLLAAQMELKERIAEENLAILALRRELREAAARGKRMATPPPPGSASEEAECKEELVKEQRRHDLLLSEIIEERYRCARLRAEIELISVQRREKQDSKTTPIKPR